MTEASHFATESAIRLLIVDDQPIIRRGLAMMLAAEDDIDVVGQASDGMEAVELALTTSPDVVVMDLQMPRASGVVATREIADRLPKTRVVVLSTYDDDDLVFEAIRAGAQAYLLKDASESEVLNTIRSVHRGESRLSPRIARKVMEQFRAFAAVPQVAQGSGETAPFATGSRPGSSRETPTRIGAPIARESLTEKELRVLDLIVQGMSNRQIAAAIHLAEGTVKNYVSRIMDKLHASSRLDLALRAVRRR